MEEMKKEPVSNSRRGEGYNMMTLLEKLGVTLMQRAELSTSNHGFLHDPNEALSQIPSSYQLAYFEAAHRVVYSTL